MTRDGYEFMFADDLCLISKKGIVVAKIQRNNQNLYPLKVLNLPRSLMTPLPDGESTNMLFIEAPIGKNGEECAFMASSYWVDENLRGAVISSSIMRL